eukprot:1178439-Prorocentrum_minimum.AAC.1
MLREPVHVAPNAESDESLRERYRIRHEHKHVVVVEGYHRVHVLIFLISVGFAAVIEPVQMVHRKPVEHYAKLRGVKNPQHHRHDPRGLVMDANHGGSLWNAMDHRWLFPTFHTLPKRNLPTLVDSLETNLECSSLCVTSQYGGGVSYVRCREIV